MRPLCKEGDLLMFIDGDSNWKFYAVQRTEEFTLDVSLSATTAGTMSSSDEIAEIEPEDAPDPFKVFYQVRIGVDVGMIYTEMLSGAIRHTVFKQRVPTTSSPYVGYFNEVMSPYHQPEEEIFLQYNQKPAFYCYNNWGFTITPRLALRGLKLRCLDLQCPASANFLMVSPGTLDEWVSRMKNNTIPHRRITVYGIDR